MLGQGAPQSRQAREGSHIFPIQYKPHNPNNLFDARSGVTRVLVDRFVGFPSFIYDPVLVCMGVEPRSILEILR